MTTEIKRRHYTPEFKQEAVALVTEHGYSVTQAAQAVGVSENNLRRWRKDLEREAGGDHLSADERAELIRLRRENKELRMEKEILKNHSPGTPGLVWTETRDSARLGVLPGQRPLAFW